MLSWSLRTGHRTEDTASASLADDGPPEHWIRYVRQRAPWLARRHRPPRMVSPLPLEPAPAGPVETSSVVGPVSRVAPSVPRSPAMFPVGPPRATAQRPILPDDGVGSARVDRAAPMPAFGSDVPIRPSRAAIEHSQATSGGSSSHRVVAVRQPERGEGAALSSPSNAPLSSVRPMVPPTPAQSFPVPSPVTDNVPAMRDSGWAKLERDLLGQPTGWSEPVSSRRPTVPLPPPAVPFHPSERPPPTVAGNPPAAASDVRVARGNEESVEPDGWPELPDAEAGGQAWETPAHRHLVREQRRQARLRAEQAGSSWSEPRS